MSQQEESFSGLTKHGRALVLYNWPPVRTYRPPPPVVWMWTWKVCVKGQVTRTPAFPTPSGAPWCSPRHQDGVGLGTLASRLIPGHHHGDVLLPHRPSGRFRSWIQKLQQHSPLRERGCLTPARALQVTFDWRRLSLHHGSREMCLVHSGSVRSVARLCCQKWGMLMIFERLCIKSYPDVSACTELANATL